MVVHPLESGARPHHSFGAAVPSIVVHGTIILLVVQLTAHASLPKPKPPEVTEVYFAPPPRQLLQFPTAQHVVEATQRSTSHNSVLPSVPLPSFHIPTALPTDVEPARVTGNDFAPDAVANHSNFAIGGQGQASNGPLNSPFTEAEVDRQVQVLASVAPRYPDVLRDAHVQGTVLAQFVVDTTGRVEPGSFHALRSDNDLFTESVRATVGAMRFRPAEAGGRRVRQLVQQPFSFALR